MKKEIGQTKIFNKPSNVYLHNKPCKIIYLPDGVFHFYGIEFLFNGLKMACGEEEIQQ